MNTNRYPNESADGPIGQRTNRVAVPCRFIARRRPLRKGDPDYLDWREWERKPTQDRWR